MWRVGSCLELHPVLTRNLFLLVHSFRASDLFHQSYVYQSVHHSAHRSAHRSVHDFLVEGEQSADNSLIRDSVESEAHGRPLGISFALSQHPKNKIL